MIEIAKESLVDVYRKYNAKQIKMFKFSPKRLGWLLLPFYLVLFALYHMYLLLFSPFVSLRTYEKQKKLLKQARLIWKSQAIYIELQKNNNLKRLDLKSSLFIIKFLSFDHVH